MVPKVVRHIRHPDVMLLQETRTDLLVQLIMNSYPGRYMQVCAGNKKEARVIYDCQRFEGIDLSMTVLKMVVNELAMANPCLMFPSKDVKKFMNRISIVGLTHRVTGEIFIVMSFHNVNRKKYSKRLAARFCQIVQKIAINKNALVIAGADFNCGYNSFRGNFEDIRHNLDDLVDIHVPYYWDNFVDTYEDDYEWDDYEWDDCDQDDYDITTYDFVEIPYYQPTGRRRYIIDLFVKRNPTYSIRPSINNVYAFNFLPYDWCEPFYHTFAALQRDVPQYNQLDYSLALDHDPLVMELTIPTTYIA